MHLVDFKEKKAEAVSFFKARSGSGSAKKFNASSHFACRCRTRRLGACVVGAEARAVLILVLALFTRVHWTVLLPRQT